MPTFTYFLRNFETPHFPRITRKAKHLHRDAVTIKNNSKQKQNVTQTVI